MRALSPTFNQYKIFALSLLALGTLASTPTFADNTVDGEHGRKEDNRFESENEFELFPIYGDGIMGAEYTGTFTNGNTKHGMNLRIESNPFSMCRYKDIAASKTKEYYTNCVSNHINSYLAVKRALFFPVTLTARLDFDPTKTQSSDEQAFLLTKFKQSVFRLLLDAGFTVEGLGYQNQFVQTGADPYQGFRMQGFEIFDVKTVQAIKTGSDNFQIVFSAGVSFGLGWINSPTARKAFEFGTPGEKDDLSRIMISSTADGSVGIRVARRVVAEVIGGAEINKYMAKAAVTPLLVHPFVGGRVNARVFENKDLDLALDLNLGVQRDFYLGDLQDLGGARDADGKTVKGGTTFHW